MMVGRKLDEGNIHVSVEPGETCPAVIGLTGSGVHDELYKAGANPGCIGLMGAGRTELMKVIYGALPK